MSIAAQHERVERTEVVLRSGRFDHVPVRAARELIDGTADLTTPPITRRFYGGCIRQPGHYLWMLNGPKPREQYGPASPIPWDSWDGPLQPKGGREGVALLSYKREEEGGPIWTALGFVDCTVDKRPGSHSTFFADSHLSFAAMLADAREHWPQIFERFTFEISEAPRT